MIKTIKYYYYNGNLYWIATKNANGKSMLIYVLEHITEHAY